MYSERAIPCPCLRGTNAAEITDADGTVTIIACDDCQDEIVRSPLTVFFVIEDGEDWDDASELCTAVIDGGLSIYSQLPVHARPMFSVWTGDIDRAIHTYASVQGV